MDGDLLGQVLSPLMTAALAGLAVLLRDWRQSRRWEHRRDRILTQGRAEIGYIQDWLEAYGQVSAADPAAESRTTRAVTDLERSYAGVWRELARAEAERPGHRSMSWWVSVLLLRGVRRPWARLVRVVYLVSLVGAVLAAVVWIPLGIDYGDPDVAFEVVVAVLTTGLLAVPVALLHWLARSLDRP